MPLATETRVPARGARGRDEDLWLRTEENLARHAACGKAAIDRRIAELENEPDIESMIERDAALAGLAGAFLAFLAGRRWFILPAVAAGLLLQYSGTRQGLAADALRRLGYRSRREIECERFGLKALRGDFENIPKAGEEPHREISAILEAEKNNGPQDA
jgi:hypothetical protein